MKKEYLIINLLTLVVFPISAVALTVIGNALQFGFVSLSPDFWLQSAIHTFVLLSFFVPFKAYYKRRFKESSYVKAAEEDYKKHIGLIYKEGLCEFRDWIKEDLKQRQNDYLERTLELANVDAKTFKDKYQNAPMRILHDRRLTWVQKKHLFRINKILNAKPVRAEDILPRVSEVQFNGVPTNPDDAEKRLTISKVLSSFFFGAGQALLVLTIDPTANWVLIVAKIAINLIGGMWYVFGAYRVAHRVVNNYYVQSLAEKKLVVQNFCAAKSIKLQ